MFKQSLNLIKTMKKGMISLAILLVGYSISAQDYTDKSDYNEYNHWSVEFQGGVTKASRPFTSGYYTRTPSFWQGDLGVRYMINEKFGLKFAIGYNSFKSSSKSKNFKSDLLRASIEGVVNGGNLLGFSDWTNRINFLVHGGVGVGTLRPKEAKKKFDFFDDNLGFFIAGISPQFKINDHWAVSGDLSMIGNFRQDFSFDGNSGTSTRGFNGMYMNSSLGITYYFGKDGEDKVHADWYSSNDSYRQALREELDRHEQEIEQNKQILADITLDKNGNGIPDALESSLDQRYKKGSEQISADAVKELVNNGYLNTYFEFNSSKPENYSLPVIGYIVHYMKENPNSTVELHGYADELGDRNYNLELSKKRADSVKTIMIAAGISGEKIMVFGEGVDGSVDKNSEAARQLVRRVFFKIK